MGKNLQISIKNLTSYYADNIVYKDISLDIRAGEITALIGPSGCGKSTLLRHINRINDEIVDYRHTGETRLNLPEHDGMIEVYNPKVQLPALRRHIGMVFQRPMPFPMSVYDNVAYAPRLHGIHKKSELDHIVEKTLQQTILWNEVKDKLHDNANTLSGGQQQRLCIARALAVKPKILLMDEPCASLDPIATIRIEDILFALKNEITIVIVTHNMQQASRLSDYTGVFWRDDVMQHGFLLEYGMTEQVFSDPVDPRTEGYLTGRFG